MATRKRLDGPFSRAVIGVDFAVERDRSVASFIAMTPEGAVYLGELAEVGFFDTIVERDIAMNRVD